jgi:superfamily II DNA or RNA helicase
MLNFRYKFEYTYLKIFKEYFEQQNIDFAYLDGSTTNREEVVNHFKQDEEKQVFLISIKAGGVGLNLTEADYVFILDPWWNPAVEQQAIDRTHRIGQKNNVFIYKFITRNTVEEKILALQGRKKQIADSLIITEESFIKTLTTFFSVLFIQLGQPLPVHLDVILIDHSFLQSFSKHFHLSSFPLPEEYFFNISGFPTISFCKYGCVT